MAKLGLIYGEKVDSLGSITKMEKTSFPKQHKIQEDGNLLLLYSSYRICNRFLDAGGPSVGSFVLALAVLHNNIQGDPNCEQYLWDTLYIFVCNYLNFVHELPWNEGKNK